MYNINVTKNINNFQVKVIVIMRHDPRKIYIKKQVILQRFLKHKNHNFPKNGLKPF